MIVFSFNVRSLGGRPKWKVLREYVRKEAIDVLCLQEIKWESISDSICYKIWGNREVKWKVVPAINKVGGVMCI